MRFSTIAQLLLARFELALKITTTNEFLKKNDFKLQSENKGFRMEIICAGFPKTATKSCSAALRELDYNVADMRENFLHLMPVYEKYFNQEASINDVLETYKNINCSVNQDWPSNMLWEELFNASPNAKVVLTGKY